MSIKLSLTEKEIASKQLYFNSCTNIYISSFSSTAGVLAKSQHFLGGHVFGSGWPQWKMWWTQLWIGVRFCYSNSKAQNKSGKHKQLLVKTKSNKNGANIILTQ